jgi:hypothetical protein
MAKKKSNYFGGSTIINPQAEARAKGKRIEGNYAETRTCLIRKIKRGNWDVGFINNNKLYGEIVRRGGLACWAIFQPELNPAPANDTEQALPPLPIARKPPSNRRRR